MGAPKTSPEPDLDALDESWDADEPEPEDEPDDDVDSLEAGWGDPKRGRTAAEKARARDEKARLRAERQKARAQHPVHFAHIILDDLAAREVLEDDHRKGEIELQPPADSEAPPPMRRHRGEILAVVANHVRAWKAGHRLARLPHHLPADIHCPDFTEITGEGPCHPARATADLQHPHVLRIPSLADILQVVENLLLHGDLPGLEEFLVRPLVLPGHHVMAGIFPRPAIPIAAHLDELPGDLRTGHLLYCN